MTPAQPAGASPYCQGADWKPRKSTGLPGTCGACGEPLVGRTHWFCPTPRGEQYGECCRARYARNHFWREARPAALKRDGLTCRRCGWIGTAHGILEVHHVEPRNGRGYRNGCHHHQDNLVSLCHSCHVSATKRQRGRMRRERDEAKLARWKKEAS